METINVNSGHGYNRAHSIGSVLGIGSMNEIENAILGDINSKISAGFKFATPKKGKVDYTSTVNGQKLGYNAMRLDDGLISVSTYFIPK